MEAIVGFVDLSGFTALTEAHGDEGAVECAERFYQLAQRALVAKTRIVKRIGDAVMLMGVDPVASVASVAKMVALAEAEPEFPALRAGLYAGPVVERDGDYFGATVNLAARLGAYARAGEILCGASLADALRRDGAFRLVGLGDVKLKNVAHPVAVYSVVPLNDADLARGAIDPVCRMRVTQAKVTMEYGGRSYAFCSDACADQFRASPGTFGTT